MNIFAADTETLGLIPGEHRVIELSFARVTDGDWSNFKIETFRFVPRPEHFVKAHPKALEVNGYREGHPDWKGAPEIGSPEAADIWRYVVSRTRGAALLCQNVPFDRGMMWEEMRLHGAYAVPHGVGPEDGPWEKHFIEVRKCSTFLQKKHGWRSASLNPLYEACCSTFGAPQLPHQHRSESDVLRALWVWAHASALSGDASVPELSVKMAIQGWLKGIGTETREATLPGPLKSVEYRVTLLPSDISPPTEDGQVTLLPSDIPPPTEDELIASGGKAS